uniref:Uncharacterized protein n=1 Tax=Setaria italica TaxID=4555 RepID=K3Z1U1_SETIT
MCVCVRVYWSPSFGTIIAMYYVRTPGRPPAASVCIVEIDPSTWSTPTS